MQDLLLDVRHALRGFRKTPAFTLVAVLSLALAIGANGFVFAVLNTVVLRPFELSDPQSLYQIRYGPRMSGSNLTTSYPAFQDLRRRNTSFSDMIGLWAYSEASLGGRDAGPKLSGVAVSSNYFDMLGVQPQIGRLFHAAEERGLNSAPYVVLSDAFWRRVFGGDSSVVGMTVRLNDQPFTVIGVAATSFHGTERFSWPDYWIPIVNNLEGLDLESRDARAVLVIGRLKPGVTPQQATADLNAITAQLAKEYPKTDKAVWVRLIRPGLMGDDGEGIRRFLYSVNVLALLLLAAVCVNLASAFAARAADRSRELAVRVALGSSRLRLVLQLLTEALVIVLIGGAAGLTSARVLLAALNRWPASLGSGHRRLDLDLDPRMYLAGLALTVASALLIGMVPARQAWTGSPLQMIKNGPADPAGRRFSLRDVLLVAQIAICALLVMASLVPPTAGRRRSVRGGERVRRRAETEVRRVVPVLAIVPRLVGRAAREVGDFVRWPARIREEAVRDLEERRLLFLGKLRELAVLCLHAEPRARVDRQLIAGQVLRLQRDSRGQVEPPVLHGLAPQAEDEIDRHRVEAGGQGRIDCGPRLSSAVTAAEETQRLVREGLDPERQGAGAEGPPIGAGFRCHVLGVGLEEDPGRGGRECEVRAARVKHARELFRRQLRGRSAAEVHGVERPRVAPRGRGERNLRHQPRGEALAGGGCRVHHREIAVRADRRTEGNVEVEPGSRGSRVTHHPAPVPTPRPRHPPSGARPRMQPAGSRPTPPSSSSSCLPSVSRCG